MTMVQSKAGPSGPGPTIEGWWKGLDRDRGGRAALRRCGSVLEVQLLPVFHSLAQRLPHTAEPGPLADRLAAVAAVLSHVEENVTGKSFAELLATTNDSGRVLLSDLRFRRLVAVESPDELLGQMRRAVQITGRSAPVISFANDLVYWGDNVRKRWAFAYYGAAPVEKKQG